MGSWEKKNTIWQYRENGELVTGWKEIDGKWYLVGSGGNMLLGWQKSKDRWYYLKQESDRKAGEAKNAYGFMLTGWQQLNGKWYFFHEDGSMAVYEWVKDKGKWYFLRSNGEMARNQMRSYKGKSYYFKAAVWRSPKPCPGTASATGRIRTVCASKRDPRRAATM